MSLTLIGKKRGMTRLFDSKSNKSIPCTVIELEPNVVSQIKTIESDGYTALQLSAFKMNSADKNRARKPDLGRYAKINIEPRKYACESRLEKIDEEFVIGKEVGVDYFAEDEFVDVTGTSKGHGYQGVIKRHGKSSIAGSHGVGPVERHMGSIGSIRGKGQVKPGKKMAGHMGDERVTTEMLRVIKVDVELSAIVVTGAIPGSVGGLVYVRKAMKKRG
jgi:large subunit ribosomal protein L3